MFEFGNDEFVVVVFICIGEAVLASGDFDVVVYYFWCALVESTEFMLELLFVLGFVEVCLGDFVVYDWFVVVVVVEDLVIVVRVV